MDDTAHMLDTLLAVIHGDGGRHTAKVGVEQSVKDAIAIYATSVRHSKDLADSRNQIQANATRLSEALDQLEETERRVERLRNLLNDIADAIHGPSPSGNRHSFFDLPAAARLLKAKANG